MHCGVATIRTILQIIWLFCGISSLVYGSFATETYNFKTPINRRHPMCPMHCVQVCIECAVSNHHKRHSICTEAAQAASWMRVSDPLYTLLFDLYHWLWISLLSDFTNLTEPGSISAGVQWTCSLTTGLQEGFRAVYYVQRRQRWLLGIVTINNSNCYDVGRNSQKSNCYQIW